MTAKFRCCGNRTTAGHAPDCPIRGSEEGCQFDILRFRHIGECKGTCDGEEEITRFADDSVGGGLLTIVMVDLRDATPEQTRDLEKRGLRRLTEEEITKIIDLHGRGELEVQVTTMTLAELEEEYSLPGETPKEEEKPDDPFLTVRKAALALGFTEGWVRALCRDKRLPGAIKLMRKWAIPTSAIFEKEEA